MAEDISHQLGRNEIALPRPPTTPHAIGASVMASEFIVGSTLLPDGTLDLSKAASWIDMNTSVPERESLQEQFDKATDEIKLAPMPKAPYSIENADREKPYTHYTSPGNIFQILRFGIHSGYFKNRLSPKREDDATLDETMKQMTGFRLQPGASYQGKDSISLGVYSSHTPSQHDMVLLVDPTIKVFGLEPGERDPSKGYGKGIVPSGPTEGFDISNPIAYGTEVLAANIIPPSAIKAITLNRWASITRGLQEVTRNNVLQYSQLKLTNPELAREELFANSRLLATLADSPEANVIIDEASTHLDALPFNEQIQAINNLQKELLKVFVKDKVLNETTLREALENKFGFKFIAA